MAANRQVFASNAERTNYYKLSRQWGDKYRLYHNLPFLNVFNTKDLIDTEKLYGRSKWPVPNESLVLTVNDIDFNRLKKTSIDFTLCDGDDRPLVCIEFDGLNDGFNLGTEYRFDGPPDPWRELITGLKLRVAHGSQFPYFVVGYSQFKDVAEDVELTMVDGIIGEVLANLATHERVGKGFSPEEVGMTQEAFDGLTRHEQYEVVEDWFIGVEVEAELTHNPISARVVELQRQIPAGCSLTWLSYPNPDVAKTSDERARMLDAAVFKGCRCELFGGIRISNGQGTDIPCPFGPISETVWLPNFRTPCCYLPLGLAENLAKLVALEKAKKQMRKQPAVFSLTGGEQDMCSTPSSYTREK